MAAPLRHPWNVSPARAVAIQRRLRGLVETQPRLGTVRLVAGIDISVNSAPEGRGVQDRTSECPLRARAAVVVLAFPSLEPVEVSVVERPCRFPYVPGLLSFREGPSILAAFRRLRTRPDLLLFDGHGIAHPRRFGIASHIGLRLDLPSIGCAKSRLTGGHAEPGRARGSWAPLIAPAEHGVRGSKSKVQGRRRIDRTGGSRDDGSRTEDIGPWTGDPGLPEGDIIGAALRTREGVKPVYVSIGHRVDLATAIEFTMRCTGRYRLPEPTRLAHQAAGGRPVGNDGRG